VEGGLLDTLWPLGALVMGLAAWQPSVRTVRPDHVPSVVVPVMSALVALGLLIYDHFSRISTLAVVLVGAAMLAVVARLGLTHRQSRASLALTRRQATTDALTGLGNRFALMRDLEQAAADHGTLRVLLLFDLDGFKNYNDAYGHPAGDALLRRLGDRLEAAVTGRGTAYRMGGDEFCVLSLLECDDHERIGLTAAHALSERGEGFHVTASHGSVKLPTEAGTATEALREADRRMYARKSLESRSSAGRQSADVLLSILSERNQELGVHLDEVTALAEAVADRIGLSDEELAPLLQAASLHDVGKAAIPDDILHKTGPLDDDEWKFMRRHTVIGERILASAPALMRASKLVRWSHERFDGDGYPDRLAGEDIPLGSRIIAVCDAYDAMVSDRPYRAALTTVQALGELRRCAGAQFDPEVVEMFGQVLTDRERRLFGLPERELA